MSSPSLLQCLFCNHFNPGGATFCNDCGSQLQLQQCDLCGSINKRSARVCYKCGAPFSAPAAHGGYPAIDGGQAGAVLGQPGEQRERTTLPESAAQAFGARQREFPDDGLAVPAAGDRGKAAATIPRDLVRGRSPGDVPPIDLAFSPEAAATTGFRKLYPIAGLVLVIALVFLSVHYYRGPPPSEAADAGVEQTAAAAPPDDPASAGAAPAAPSTPPAGAWPGNRSIMTPVFRVLGVPEEASPPSGAAATGRPTVDGGAAVGQGPPAHNSCQEAVVALGLCGASAKQEKP